MSNPTVQQLFPVADSHSPLKGLYLRHDLRAEAAKLKRPFVFSNFIVSLDGRIATPKPDDSGQTEVPPSMANGRDWRLFQELAAQSDIYLVSGRYMNNLYNGRTTKMMNLEDPGNEDLALWRRERQLSQEPDIAVLSRTLAFGIPAFLADFGVTVHIFTPEIADKSEMERLKNQGGQIHTIPAGQETVPAMMAQFAEMGIKVVMSPAGPNILHQLIDHKFLDRLYLTHATQLLGRAGTIPLTDGEMYQPAFDMRLRELYLDPAGANGTDQFMVTYEPI